MNKQVILGLFFFCILTGWSAIAQPNKQAQLEEKRQTILEEIKQINSLL